MALFWGVAFVINYIWLIFVLLQCCISGVFVFILGHCQVLNCDRFPISPYWILLAILCWSWTTFCDLTVFKPQDHCPVMRAYSASWQQWDNAAAHILNISATNQSPSGYIYGYIMVVISLSEHSVVWSFCVINFSFNQTCNLVIEWNLIWPIVIANILTTSLIKIVFASLFFCIFSWSSFTHSVLAVSANHYRWQSGKLKLLNEGRINTLTVA